MQAPDWQQQFLLVNENSTGRYRSHALVQALGGIRPTEFDPLKNQPNGTAGQSQVAPGVVVTLCGSSRVRVRVPGGKVGSHAGQVERVFELEQQALPQWFVQELQAAAGSKTVTAKPQALRDHYERVSKQVFKDMTYGKSKKPLHVTPYCFRHIVATDLRESGWAVEEIAAALGQRSADTQFQYGFRNGGKRKPQAGKQAGIVKGSVAATSPVTPPKSTWAQVSSKIQNGKAKNSPKL